MRKLIALSASAALTAGLAVVAAAPASACTTPDTTSTSSPSCVDTTVNVSLTGGALSIQSDTPTVTMSGALGSTLTGSMGTTTVTDNRGTLAGWQATALSNGDLASTSTPGDTIPLTAAGPLTVTISGLSVVTDPVLGALGVAGDITSGAISVPTLGAGINNTTPAPLATANPLSGGGSYAFNPSLSLTPPPGTVAHDDYSVIVSQSVY